MELVVAALTFGLTAGLKPGPLGIYVIHQTLSHGLRAGMIASLAPFVSDIPIILASYLLVSGFKQFDSFIALLSFLGAGYLAFISIQILISKPDKVDTSSAPGRFFTAVKINLLNPAPYLFWGTVGGAYMAQHSLSMSVMFVVVFLATLSLSKTALAASINALGQRFSRRGYEIMLKLLAVMLLLFAFRLLMDAFTYL